MMGQWWTDRLAVQILSKDVAGGTHKKASHVKKRQCQKKTICMYLLVYPQKKQVLNFS